MTLTAVVALEAILRSSSDYYELGVFKLQSAIIFRLKWVLNEGSFGGWSSYSLIPVTSNVTNWSSCPLPSAKDLPPPSTSTNPPPPLLNSCPLPHLYPACIAPTYPTPSRHGRDGTKPSCCRKRDSASATPHMAAGEGHIWSFINPATAVSATSPQHDRSPPGRHHSQWPVVEEAG